MRIRIKNRDTPSVLNIYKSVEFKEKRHGLLMRIRISVFTYAYQSGAKLRLMVYGPPMAPSHVWIVSLHGSPWLHMAPLELLRLLNFDFDEDPDPAFKF